MSATTVGAGESRGTEERFLELVCADEELVRAEFEAIVAAQWTDPPMSRYGPHAGGHQRGSPVRAALVRLTTAPSGLWRTGPDRKARQRSPPSARVARRSVACKSDRKEAVAFPGSAPTRLLTCPQIDTPPPTATTPADRTAVSLIRSPGRPGVGRDPEYTPQHTVGDLMTSEGSGLYAVLRVATNATQEEITQAYRSLLRRHHPDTRQLADESQRAQSDAALQQVLAAYAVLRDPARRADYDRRARRASTPAPAGAAPVRHGYWRGNQPPIVAGPVHWQKA